MDSPTQSPPDVGSDHENGESSTQIPVEIVSDEEMALIEAAFAAARSYLAACSSASPEISLASTSSSVLSSSTQFQRNARLIRSITLLSKRRLSSCMETGDVRDIEDVGSTQKAKRVTESFFHRYRRTRGRGLTVTDITGTEWCEKQMEFFLRLGRPGKTKAMKAGIARHAELEEEVVKRIKVRAETAEDIWALKLINFIIGTQQLLFDGLTRELPIFGYVEGVWVVGVIDEIRMPVTKTERNPKIVDTKTRIQATLPSEAQRRNGRLQVMCYKHLWDCVTAGNFPLRQFFEFFSLNQNYILSEEIREIAAKSGFQVKTLGELVRCFKNACSMLPQSNGQLLLRYESQEDNSLIGEDWFAHDPDWLEREIKTRLEFWMGKREADYTPKEERWKCRSCHFASECLVNSVPECGPISDKHPESIQTLV